MDKKNKLYFAYGANLNKDSMSYRCPEAKPVGRATAYGWRRIFRSVADIIPSRRGMVQGCVWEITPRCEKSLNRFEGFPRLYTKKDIEVELESGKTVVAMVYIMNPKAGRTVAPPSQGYYDTIKQGLKDFGYDERALRVLSGQAKMAAIEEEA